MEYRKVGRGGAGNYYSQKDIEEASKKAAQQKDLEAQKSLHSTPANANDAPQRKYAYSGRGGAGNLKDASTLAATAQDPADIDPSSQMKSSSSTGHYGRGGAGNYAAAQPQVLDGQPGERELQEIKRPDVFATSEVGLQEPAKAHLSEHKSRDDA